MELKAKLKQLAEELGADYFGIANLSMEKTSALRVCGMCLYICPYGRKKINNS
ncbi:MAG: hypothetical protein AB1Z31_26310 [Desulfobacterales bacterium]